MNKTQSCAVDAKGNNVQEQDVELPEHHRHREKQGQSRGVKVVIKKVSEFGTVSSNVPNPSSGSCVLRLL